MSFHGSLISGSPITGSPFTGATITQPPLDSFTPSLLFASNETGVWYDPSDLTTLYQDTAGTTPVTAAGQSVALMLDKSKGLALGPELVTNGDFSDGSTGWNLGIGWTVSGGVATHAAGTSSAINQTGAIIQGKTYVCIVTVSGRTQGSWYWRLGNTTNLEISNSNGTFTKYIVGTATGNYIGIFGDSAFDGSIDNISVRELPGNHATQSITASRPIYAVEPTTGRRNLLTYSEQFDAAAGWSSNIGGTGAVATISANAGNSPLGDLTAERLQTSRSTALVADRSTRASAVTNINFISGVNYTVSFWAKSFSGSNQDVHLFVNANGATAQNFVATAEWQRFTYTFTSGATILASAAPVRFGLWGTASAALTSDVLIWGAQLETGSTATAYQRVVSKYDVTEAGVPSRSYLSFDGVDDFLSIGQDANAFFGSTVTSDPGYLFAIGGRFDAVSTNSASPWVYTALFGDMGSYLGFYGKTISGVSSLGWYHWHNASSIVESGFTVGANFIASAYRDPALGASGRNHLSVNAGAAATVDVGALNATAGTLLVGRQGNTAYGAGRIYGLIVRGAQSTDSQITNTETWLNGKTGAY